MKASRITLSGSMAAILLSACGALAQTTAPSGTLKGAAPAQSPPVPQPGDGSKPAIEVNKSDGAIKSADDLLTQLETADADLKSLDADLLYVKVFGLEADEQERSGKLYYVDTKAKDDKGKPAQGSRKFAINFKTLKMGRQPAMPQDQILVFDGEWFIEKKPQDQQIIKRRISRPGQAFDPLKVGEGPFPLPVGQKRDDILKKFDAVLLKDTEGFVAHVPEMQKPLEQFVSGAYQVKLTPKPGGEPAELSEIRLWYRVDKNTGKLLPRMARTETPQGDVSIVQLVNVQVNQTVPPEVLDTATPAGWKEVVQELGSENRR